MNISYFVKPHRLTNKGDPFRGSILIKKKNIQIEWDVYYHLKECSLAFFEDYDYQTLVSKTSDEFSY